MVTVYACLRWHPTLQGATVDPDASTYDSVAVTKDRDEDQRPVLADY